MADEEDMGGEDGETVPDNEDEEHDEEEEADDNRGRGARATNEGDGRA